MQYFYVKTNVQLRLPHKQKQLLSPTQEQLENNQIPLDRIYCGYIAWEQIQAKQQIGESSAVILSEALIDKRLLPYRIRPFSEQGSIIHQLERLPATNKPLKIGVINGTGTMLGDTIIGASALEHIANDLRALGLIVQFDIYVAWNARPGVESIWQRNPNINKVFSSSPTLKELQGYDAHLDFSQLLRIPGYSSEHYADFYYNSFGVNPDLVTTKAKLPIIRASELEYTNTRTYIEKFTSRKPFVFVQPDASTPGRSLPAGAFIKLLKKLVKQGNQVVVSCAIPEALEQDVLNKILNLNDWTKNNLDRYISAIALSHSVITVDTLALHIAMGCNKPGIGLFSLTEPERLLKYSPQIRGYLIEDAEKLPYWQKFKSDEQWAETEKLYQSRWEKLIDLITN